jgi:MFS transporter, DHA2 family, glioxin efflux transporter
MTILSTAIPRITDQFNSLEDVGWYGSVFFMTVASFQSTWGKVYKYFDLKYSFLTTIFIFEVGSLICGECILDKPLRWKDPYAGSTGSMDVDETC